MYVCIYACMCVCMYVVLFMYWYAGMYAFAVCFLSLFCLCLEHSTAQHISFSMLRYARCGSNQDVVSARRIMMLPVEGQLAAGFGGYVLVNSGLPSASFSAFSIYHL